jgi:hypothetical protein
MTTAPALDLDQPLQLHPLTFLDEGDEVTAGRADISSYGLFPADGAALLRRLAAGSSPNEAAAWYTGQYGERVDIGEFLEVLGELRLIVSEGETAPPPAAVRWQGLGRAVFSRPAWACYLLLVAAAIAEMIREPYLLPDYHDLFFTRSSLVLLTLGIVLGQVPWLMLHEAFHALAGRRLGLNSTLRVGRRFYYVVFVTSLDGLVAVPRRQRYLPFLAGMLLDLLAIAALTLGAAPLHDATGAGAVCYRLLLSMAFGVVLRFSWQFYFFLRTDLYYFAATLLGCNDLQAAAKQVLHDRARRLLRRPPGQATMIATGRELAIARWYSWLMLAGYAFLAAMLVSTAVPVAIRLTELAAHELIVARSPLHAADALGFLALNSWEPMLAAALALRTLRRRHRPAEA